jgi:hypothetical protein
MAKCNLQQILSSHDINPKCLQYLIKQSLEMERMRLEFLQSCKCDTIDSFSKIMQGERFLTLLIATGGH